MIVAAMPPAAATHGDTAYLVGLSFPFVAESHYVGGPGYLNQDWQFDILSVAGPERCVLNGGWDPDPRPPPIGNPGAPGFDGMCGSGPMSTTGIDHFHNYPNGANGCAPVPACNGLDIHTVEVSYGGAVFEAQLIICDNGTNTQLSRISRTYCTDFMLLGA